VCRRQCRRQDASSRTARRAHSCAAKISRPEAPSRDMARAAAFLCHPPFPSCLGDHQRRCDVVTGRDEAVDDRSRCPNPGPREHEVHGPSVAVCTRC
jgi:hypothetical protein